jgi:hypothetical protein
MADLEGAPDLDRPDALVGTVLVERLDEIGDIAG